MKEIVLSQGKIALVDDEDYDRLMVGPKWQATRERTTGNYYAVRTIRKNGNQKSQQMAQFILGASGRKNPTDHINHDTLDNRRANIRIVSPAQNKQNSLPYSGGASQYKGVTKKYDRAKCWGASIRIDGKLKYLGNFYQEKEAALAYDKAARQYFGEFAHCNFPSQESVDDALLTLGCEYN